MGAVEFVKSAEGYSANECFDRLVENALEQYGADGYNGTISTCSLSGRPRVLAKEYSKEVVEKAHKLIDEEGGGEKWIAKCLDLGAIRYEVRTIKKSAPKSKKPPKFQMRYVVREVSYRNDGMVLKTFPSNQKTEADKFALAAALKGKDVEVAKDYVLTEGCNVTTQFTEEVKRYDKKPKLKPMPNRVINEVHKYLFYGLAAE